MNLVGLVFEHLAARAIGVKGVVIDRLPHDLADSLLDGFGRGIIVVIDRYIADRGYDRLG